MTKAEDRAWNAKVAVATAAAIARIEELERDKAAWAHEAHEAHLRETELRSDWNRAVAQLQAAQDKVQEWMREADGNLQRLTETRAQLQAAQEENARLRRDKAELRRRLIRRGEEVSTLREKYRAIDPRDIEAARALTPEGTPCEDEPETPSVWKAIQNLSAPEGTQDP